MGLRQQPCTSSSYWLREFLAPPNNNGPNNNRRGRELSALRALLPAMRRCLSTGRSKRSPLRKDKLLMAQQSLPWRSLPPQPFQYEYGVKDDYSGNAFAKTETQNDLGQVQGSYKVNLPDGRVQTVTYHADHEGGFVAEVTYEGTPQYPEPPPGGYGPYKGPGAYPGPPPPGSYTRRR